MWSLSHYLPPDFQEITRDWVDELIASRQKSGGGRQNNPRRCSIKNTDVDNTNKISNADRSIATSQAKRDARLRARRGLSTDKKASAMEIEAQVQKQGKQTLLARAKKALQAKRSTGSNAKLTDSDRSDIRQERRKLARAAAKVKREELASKRTGSNRTKQLGAVAESAPLGRPPSKKAVKAAMTAMEEKGFTVPDGFQMVISFAPTNMTTVVGPPSTDRSNTTTKPAARKNPPKNQNNQGNNNGTGRRGGRN